MDLEGQDEKSFPDRIMVAEGKVQKRGERKILGRGKSSSSLHRMAMRIQHRAWAQSLSGRHRLLLPSGRSSARSREGQLRKRYKGHETLENSF